MPQIVPRFFRRHFQIIAFLLLSAGGAMLYTRAVTTNPEGFYLDESSIAYNAHLIAQTGHDEHGETWPLYFRAFGDYKNPVYIYLLAALFKLTGPSISAARLLSALLGFAAALLIGLLAWQVTKQRLVAFVLLMAALLTPWVFELSRVVVEVALYPLLIAMLLLVVHQIAKKERWTWRDASALACVLALLTYTYSIGRLLGPLLALGLLLFLNRIRLWSIAKVWILYGLCLLPLLIFQRRHPGALSARYQLLTFITPQTSYAEDVLQFGKHLLGNINPWKMIFSGDPNAFQIASVYGAGPVLVAVLILMLLSLGLLWGKNQFSPWWRFVVYGLAVSFIPASLTRDYFHTLRLAAVPVFMLALTIPALEWISRGATLFRRAILFGSIALILIQGFYFQRKFNAGASIPRRLDLFDADYASTILPLALAKSGDQPILIADAPPIPGYIQAFWHATVQNIPLGKFTVLPVDAAAPAGSVVITTEDTCPRCDVLFKRWPYTVYIAQGPERLLSALPDEGLRAEIRIIDYSPLLKPREAATIRVAVRNAGTVPWLARERAAAPFQINVGNHWLDRANRTVINDDGRATLLRDLLPGAESEFSFTVNAPQDARQYILEVDVLQENVSWFGLKGSKTLRLPVTVE
jgi:4-amino-4-deoxy-L-arabinose transferase-like glycosyltransferase